MPKFKYTAAALDGKRVRGSRDAADAAVLNSDLREEGLFLISSSQAAKSSISRKLSARELSDFNRELGSMLSSGITLARAVSIMLQRDMPRRLRDIYDALYHALIEGRAMSAAMSDQGGAFPELLVNMYRAAELNGTMAVTTERMAVHYEKEHRLQSKIISAATYPIILLCLTVTVVILIFTVVIPNLQSTYDMGEMPAITRAVISLSKIFTEQYLALIGVVIVLAAAAAVLSRMKGFRMLTGRAILRLPVIGRLMRSIYTARFSRTMSSLYASGLPVISALNASRGTIGNAYVERGFDEAIERVKAGSPISEALAAVDGLDHKLPATVLIGEESGNLEAMLIAVSDSFDYDAEQALTKLSAAMEPVMIIIMAIIVGAVMISVMLPIYNMYSHIQ